MSLIQNKPYVWVDKSQTPPTIKFIYDIEEYPGFESGEPQVSTNEDTVFIDYVVTNEEETAIRDNPISYIPSNDHYGQYEKFTIRIFSADRQLLGFHTVKPATGNFDVEGETPPPIPYTYMKVINTGRLKVEVATDFPIGVRYTGSTINCNPDNFECSINIMYDLDVNGESGIDVQSFELSDDNYYDPVCEDILIEVVVMNGGNVDRKGHGTTHGSEGDASGEG